MLYDHGSQSESLARNCRPDYESMIKRSKEQLVKTNNFLAAIFDYVGNTMVRDKMAELVGELYSTKVSLEASIDAMIKEQETAP